MGFDFSFAFTSEMAKYVVVFVLIIAIVIVVATIKILLKNIGYKLRQLPHRILRETSFGFGATLASQVINNIDLSASEKPIAISNMESIYLPKIKNKYPHLNIYDLKNKANIVLKEYLESIYINVPTSLLIEYSIKSLCETVIHISGDKYICYPFVLNNTVISNFSCVEEDNKIEIQISYKSDKQHKATINFTYTRDDNNSDEIEKKCTNCGGLLDKEAHEVGHCLYCDQVFKVVNEYKWLAAKIMIE